MSVRPNVLKGRGEIVETNSDNAIDNFVGVYPILITEARSSRDKSFKCTKRFSPKKETEKRRYSIEKQSFLRIHWKRRNG